MKYRINLARDGQHYFAAEVAHISEQEAILMAQDLRRRFPASEGFETSLSFWETSGRNISLDPASAPLPIENEPTPAERLADQMIEAANLAASLSSPRFQADPTFPGFSIYDRRAEIVLSNGFTAILDACSRFPEDKGAPRIQVLGPDSQRYTIDTQEGAKNLLPPEALPEFLDRWHFFKAWQVFHAQRRADSNSNQNPPWNPHGIPIANSNSKEVQS